MSTAAAPEGRPSTDFAELRRKLLESSVWRARATSYELSFVSPETREAIAAMPEGLQLALVEIETGQ